MNENTKEIFAKMDRQDELRSRLSLAIPELLVVDQWKTYVIFLKRCQKLLNETLTAIEKQNVTQEFMIYSEKEARFHLFNFYSCAYSIRQTMFEGKNFSKGAAEFEAVMKTWKNESIPRIVIAVRNKYQHGSLMEHVLHYESRTEHHAKGEGFYAGYNFEPTTWEKVLEETTGADAKEHLKEILATNKADPITKINNDFIDSCEQISAKIQELFERVFASDLEGKKQLKDEYDEIEKWFQDRGMYAI